MSFGYSELENNNQQASILSADIAAQTTPGIERAPFSIKNELKVIWFYSNNLKLSAFNSKLKYHLYLHNNFNLDYRVFQQMEMQTETRKKC